MTPEAFAPPPPDLSKRKLTIAEFKRHLFRSHGINRNPVFFGSTGRNRFDAPDDEYKLFYAGCDPYCAFVECFGGRAGTRIVTTAALQDRALTELVPARSLQLIDLTRSGSLVRIGADARLFSGEHKISQLWSLALHAHPAKADGLLYPSRLDPEHHAVALFGDRSPKLKELSRQSWYAPGPQRHLLGEIIDHYDFRIIESKVSVRKVPPAREHQRGLF